MDCQIDDLLVHDETDPTAASLLSRMTNPEFPEPVGVVYAVRKPTYEELVQKQIDDSLAKKGPGKLEDLFHAEDLWTVE